MTAKTHRRPKRMRNSVMESLGFTETPSVYYVSHPSTPPRRPTRLVSTSTRPAITVEEMWDTTELETDSMIDWLPIDIDKRRLNKRIRWPMMLMWVLILAVLGFGGYSIYRAPSNAAAVALSRVAEDAAALDSTLDQFEAATDAVTPEAPEISTDLGASTTAVDGASRALFFSSADVPASELTRRSAATDAATQALDASKTLSTTAAYLGAVGPIMTGPALMTESELTDLATAATEFGEWRSRFDSVRKALPETVLSKVSAELAIISGQLDRIQSEYLDGLREQDEMAALTAIRELEGMLATTWTLLLDETESVKATIKSRIDNARSALDLLTG